MAVILTPEAGQRLFDALPHYVERIVAVYLNDELIGMPIVHTPMKRFVIMRTCGSLSEAEIKTIIRAVNTGREEPEPTVTPRSCNPLFR